jgi:hypothetical protein
MVLRSGGRVIFAYEGTVGYGAWLRYVSGAGSKPFGPPPGLCFAPFVDAVEKTVGGMQSQLQKGDRVLFTGHSLGAACAGMTNSETTRAGYWTEPACLFACPRCGNDSYFALARGSAYVYNLPYDPVPILPPQVVDFVERSPDQIRWDQVYSYFRGNFPLGAWRGAIATAQNLDYLVLMAAGSLDWQHSPHNTYQYLNAAWTALDGNASQDAIKLQMGCQALGLFDPWPSGYRSQAPRHAGAPGSIATQVDYGSQLDQVEGLDLVELPNAGKR